MEKNQNNKNKPFRPLVLTVKDIDKTVDFYTKVLGMEKEIFKGTRVALKFGNQKINLDKIGAEFEPKSF